jgi:hypothetical protein
MSEFKNVFFFETPDGIYSMVRRGKEYVWVCKDEHGNSRDYSVEFMKVQFSKSDVWKLNSEFVPQEFEFKSIAGNIYTAHMVGYNVNVSNYDRNFVSTYSVEEVREKICNGNWEITKILKGFGYGEKVEQVATNGTDSNGLPVRFYDTMWKFGQRFKTRDGDSFIVVPNVQENVDCEFVGINSHNDWLRCEIDRINNCDTFDIVEVYDVPVENAKTLDINKFGKLIWTRNHKNHDKIAELNAKIVELDNLRTDTLNEIELLTNM